MKTVSIETLGLKKSVQGSLWSQRKDAAAAIHGVTRPRPAIERSAVERVADGSDAARRTVVNWPNGYARPRSLKSTIAASESRGLRSTLRSHPTAFGAGYRHESPRRST